MRAVVGGGGPGGVPRRAARGGAVDDHQLSLARRMDAEGLVRLVEDPAGLPAAVAEDGRREPVRLGESTPLAVELRDYLRTCVGSGAGRRAR